MRVRLDPGDHIEIFGFRIINACAFPAVFDNGSWFIDRPAPEDGTPAHRGRGKDARRAAPVGSRRNEPVYVV